MREGGESFSKERVIGRWSELSETIADHSKARAMLTEARAMSGEEFDVGRVGTSGLFNATKFPPSISSTKESPRGSLFPSDQASLWALTSPMIRQSSVKRG